MSSHTNLFDQVNEYPSAEAKWLYDQLIGLDPVKVRLEKEAALLLDPRLLQDWQKKHHPDAQYLVRVVKGRPPLFLFEGDVGTGKTALAKSFGDHIARKHDVAITLYGLSLNARGSGAVGEMSKLIAAAFEQFTEAAKKGIRSSGMKRSGVILHIDEADALTQSREFSQMHHEDRAGVNALIRGIDGLTHAELPALVLMCTNRLEAIDPAVRRRAAGIYQFTRPTDERRADVLRRLLHGAGIGERDLQHIVRATGPTRGRPYGFTYSDLSQRLAPAIVLNAYPDQPVRADKVIELANEMGPTPPFKTSGSGHAEENAS